MNLKKIKFCPVCGAKIVNIQTKSSQPTHPTCLTCQFVFYQNPTPTVLAVILKNKQLLLIQRKNSPYQNLWALPGGFVEVGQTLDSALQSELDEELKVKIKTKKYFGSFVSQYELHGIKEAIVATAFKVTLQNYQFSLGDELKNVGFFALDHLPKIAPFFDNQKIIKKLKETHS